MVVCLERGADLHMAQLMPLPLTVYCFSIIQITFTFLVPGCPGQRAIKRMCVCVCVFLSKRAFSALTLLVGRHHLLPHLNPRFTFPVPAYTGCHGKKAVKWLY